MPPPVFAVMTATLTYLGLLDEEDIALDAAALELAAADHPGADLAPYGALLDAITARLADLPGEATDAASRAVRLARVIGREYGFTGDRATYDDPANADMIRVLDRRRGLPVSLAILYVAVARRMGWDADALNTPGHVLATVGAGDEVVVLDPFNGGAPVERPQIDRLLRQMSGTEAASAPVEAMGNRAILVRLLLNQATRADVAGDTARALTLYERMTVIAPGNGPGWWERARLELEVGDIGAARDSLSAMLEVTRDRERRLHIAAALDALAGSGGPA